MDKMNWSFHQTKESAEFSVENQLKITALKNGGKVVSEEEINILFEDVPIE